MNMASLQSGSKFFQRPMIKLSGLVVGSLALCFSFIWLVDTWLVWRDERLFQTELTTFQTETTTQPLPEDRWVLVDGSPPFFQPAVFERMAEAQATEYPTINWSKIPFEYLQPTDFSAIEADWGSYLEFLAELGATTVTLDDLTHLTTQPDYPPELVAEIEAYQKLYTKLLDQASAQGFDVLITTDFISTHTSTQYQANTLSAATAAARWQIDQLLTTFPQLDGVIVRIGEADGQDVNHIFKSQLVIKTPTDLEHILTQLLPTFEAQNKTLVLRTWTHGAHPIGDIFWNYSRYHQALGSINSPNLVVSAKVVPNDFFRFLPLNPVLVAPQHRVIAEFQPKQEYEMMTGFPSFIGYAYQDHVAELRQNPRVQGISLWLQTGGWGRYQGRVHFDDATWMRQVNAQVLVDGFIYGLAPVDSLAEICQQLEWCSSDQDFIRAMQLSDQIVNTLWYLGDSQPRYFRRVMIPPVTWMYWDQVVPGSPLGVVTKLDISDPAQVSANLEEVGSQVQELEQVLLALGQSETAQFVIDTVQVLQLAGQTILEPTNLERQQLYTQAANQYQTQYPDRFQFQTEFEVASEPLLRVLYPVVTRQQASYRVVDYFMLSRPVSNFFLWLIDQYQADQPEFMSSQAASYETLFE